ncbi:MAG: hypothetical protein IPK80_14325 [Nannocystis sp.]|nr:hypothetical protein [Nannocystis sp.]
MSLTLPQRALSAALRAMTRMTAGYDLGPIQEEMVRLHGLRGTFRLMKLGAEVTNRLTASFGEATAQTLIGVAALWNGCRYCVIGHIYSANLFIFRDHRVLGPLDEESLVPLMYMTDHESFAVINQRFADPRFERLRYLIDRMFRLRFQDIDPVEPEDELLKATITYWEWLNECTIILGIDAVPGQVPALGYMRPSDQLIAAYDRARAAARAAATAP